MLRTQLHADPDGRFVHEVVLESCRKNGDKTALVDTSCNRRVTFAEYGKLVEDLARGLISAGLVPGEVIAILLPNSWEFAITYHAATLAGGIPTLLESLLPRARDSLSTGKLGGGPLYYRRSPSGKCEPCRITLIAKCLHHTSSACRLPRLRESLAAFLC